MQHTYDKHLNILYLINSGQNHDEFDSDWYTGSSGAAI